VGEGAAARLDAHPTQQEARSRRAHAIYFN